MIFGRYNMMCQPRLIESLPLHELLAPLFHSPLLYPHYLEPFPPNTRLISTAVLVKTHIESVTSSCRGGRRQLFFDLGHKSGFQYAKCCTPTHHPTPCRSTHSLTMLNPFFSSDPHIAAKSTISQTVLFFCCTFLLSSWPLKLFFLPFHFYNGKRNVLHAIKKLYFNLSFRKLVLKAGLPEYPPQKLIF